MIPLWNQIAGGTLDEQQIGLLDRYLDLLIEKNQVLNLTRITDRAEAELKHVADALTLLPFLSPPLEGGGRGNLASSSGAEPHATPHPALRLKGGGFELKLADVGTGGGIPGVILAIARPDIEVTLIDSTRKKLDAVQSLCEQIGLTNVRSLHSRIEAVDQKFDIVTARAVAELETLVGWCHGLMKRSSKLLALKGPKVQEEMGRLSPRTRRNWKIEIHPVEAPELAGHNIVVAKVIG